MQYLHQLSVFLVEDVRCARKALSMDAYGIMQNVNICQLVVELHGSFIIATVN
jgi:hypothetical protein